MNDWLFILIYTLSSFLGGAVIATAVLYGRLNRAERMQEASDERIDNLTRDSTYWVEQYQRSRNQLVRYRTGLTAVVNMRTGKMANIGHRMSAAAAEALKS